MSDKKHYVNHRAPSLGPRDAHARFEGYCTVAVRMKLDSLEDCCSL